MENGNTKNEQVNKAQQEHSSSTSAPRWSRASFSGLPMLHSSSRKLYALIAIWVFVVGVALATSLGVAHRQTDNRPATTSMGENAFLPAKDSGEGAASNRNMKESTQEDAEGVDLRQDVENSMPKSFRQTSENVITDAALLRPLVSILNQHERPLRILHVGDSHVAGRSFPLAVKETLAQYLPLAEATETGGFTFNYIGKNGATARHMLSEDYLRQYAEAKPDLVILSLGTNDAHSYAYQPEVHRKQLGELVSAIQEACPSTVILLTTPPGDYLSSSYVRYQRTARSQKRRKRVYTSRQPNLMSSKCAACIRDYARENSLPVWDLFTICGGERAAQTNWVKAGYMRPDRIHFQIAGYQLQGKLLAEALAKALAATEN